MNGILKYLFLFLLIILPHPILHAQDWVPLDKGIECFFNGDVQKLYVDSVHDKLYISGSFTQDGNCVPMRGTAQWNGIRWDSIGNATAGNAHRNGIYRFNDTLLVYGNFTNANSNFYLAHWDGTQWNTFTSGPDNEVTCYAEKNGTLYLGGYFDKCGNDSTFLIGKYVNGQFFGMTPGYGANTSAWVATCMAFYQDTLYVGGNFSLEPTRSVIDFAKWDGNDLQPVDPQFLLAPSYIETMAVFRGELYVAGYFRKQDGYTGDYIMKWNGHSFSEVGHGTNGRVTAMKAHGDRLYVGGYFTQVDSTIPANYLANWDGTQWHGFTDDTFATMPLIRAIDFYRDTMIIAGNFKMLNGDTMNNIAKYNHASPKTNPPIPEQINVNFYPNPSAEYLTISIDLPSEQHVSLKIYDVRGRLVTILIDGKKQAGSYSIEYDLAGLGSGVYFIRLDSDQKSITKPMVRY